MALADDADALAAMVANHSRWCGHRCVASGYLVFKPTSGLGNSLIAAASVAALAAASCREFALDWGRSSTHGAEASFLDLFRPIDGVEFYTLADLMRKHGPPGPDCHMDMTQFVDVEDPMRPSRIALAPSPASLNISVMKGRRGRVNFPLLAQCRTVVVRSNQYFVPMLELNYRIRPALQRVGRHGLACDPSADPSVAASATGQPFFGHASRHLFVPDRHAADLADRYVASMKAGRGLVIGVHVRYVILNGAVHMLQSQRKNDTMATNGFMSCLAKVGGIARAAGYVPRIYLATDAPAVRAELDASPFGPFIAPIPAHIKPAEEKSWASHPRSASVTTVARDELLILARADAVIVHSQRARHVDDDTWLGVFTALDNCTRVAESNVEPRAAVPPAALFARDRWVDNSIRWPAEWPRRRRG